MGIAVWKENSDLPMRNLRYYFTRKQDIIAVYYWKFHTDKGVEPEYELILMFSFILGIYNS